MSNPLPVAARTLTLGLVLLVVPFLPACNLFFRVGFVIAERVLYLSSTGYCLLFAYAVGHCCCRWSKYKVEVYAVRLWYLSPHDTAVILSISGSLNMETEKIISLFSVNNYSLLKNWSDARAVKQLIVQFVFVMKLL